MARLVGELNQRDPALRPSPRQQHMVNVLAITLEDGFPTDEPARNGDSGVYDWEYRVPGVTPVNCWCTTAGVWAAHVTSVIADIEPSDSRAITV